MDDNLFIRNLSKSLANQARPSKLDQFIGQEHILGQGKVLRSLIEKDKISSVIFYGPPGTGKTTLARIISNLSKADFIEVNATDSSIKEIREICSKAAHKRLTGRKTILFMDEIHRFNKAQQDVLLPFLENNDVVFIGSTTFNPFFYITPALNSRTLIFEFKKLDAANLLTIGRNAMAGKAITLSDEAWNILLHTSNGDGRVLLNRLEVLCDIISDGLVDEEKIRTLFQTHAFSYEKSDDHYDTISAFIKSVRGSDPDAALYYLAIMLEGGEDIRFIARRLSILAAEDIGLAEPGALAVIAGGYELVEKIGMPEARIILAEMTVYLSCLPKSNSAYLAIDKALAYIRSNPPLKIPNYLMDASYEGAKKLQRGIGYKYPHSYPGHYINQKYMEKPLFFYEPGSLGREKPLKDYLDWVKKQQEKEE